MWKTFKHNLFSNLRAWVLIPKMIRKWTFIESSFSCQKYESIQIYLQVLQKKVFMMNGVKTFFSDIFIIFKKSIIFFT